ncbi:cupin domain-containing protein [Arthrobacter sp. NPDC090010]|uniref:cupin domain-containing protein n=1 Tax=Arthrobacter sp. NPDC090010 TaxID=3363942 RepID=UPI0038115078
MNAVTVLEPGSLALPGSRTERFEGEAHGLGLSYFLVRTPHGKGAALHRHPYTEMWLVLEGEATFRFDDGERAMELGSTVIVQAGTWHGFINHGQEPLVMACLHDSPRIIQEFRDETA